jgi:carboxyl-terminal processing protease
MFLCIVLAGVGVFLLTQMPKRIEAMEEQRKYDSEFYQFAELFSEIYGQIRSRYVENVDSKALFEGAINGMFTALDPHSSWLPPQAQEMLTKDTEGEYSGVGLHITLRDRILTVISPIAGSPAAKAGVLPWDRIIEIEGKTTENITLIEAVNKLTGPTGTKIKIKVWREGEAKPLDFVLTREKIKVDSVFSKEFEDGIGYLRISKFQEDTAEETKKALKKFNQDGVKGIIVDVRFDAGGLLDRAVEICNFFLPKGQLIVSTKGRIPSSNREYYAVDEQLAKQPLVVLVNHGSASASEIFAGAMKDTKRAVIIGPKGGTTYGKGSVQTISMLKHSLEHDENGDIKPSGLRLTTAKYYTPSGISIHEKGIKPDIGVDLPQGHELDLLRHGMIGDPNTIEPAEDTKAEDGASTDTEQTTGTMHQLRKGPAAFPLDDDEQTTGVPLEERLRQKRQAPAEAKPGSKEAETKQKGAFEDVLLDEAIKYMKAILIYESRKAA